MKKYLSLFLMLFLFAASGFNHNAMADTHIYRGRYTNTLDKKYQSSQKSVGGGWYLITCSNTQTKKRDIERIAKALGIQLRVEII